MSLPGFNINGQGSGPSSTIDTARQHRWKFTAFDPIKDILLFAHKCGRPGPEFDKIIMHHGQDHINFPGKNRWPPIEISFYQVVGGANDVAGAIYDWWTKSVVNLSKSKINLIKRTCELQQLDGKGVGVYVYTMYGCYVSKISPDDLDYSSSAISEITFTLEMDKATETRAAGSEQSNPNAGTSQDTQNPAPSGLNASGRQDYSADDRARQNASNPPPVPFDAAAAAAVR